MQLGRLPLCQLSYSRPRRRRRDRTRWPTAPPFGAVYQAPLRDLAPRGREGRHDTGVEPAASPDAWSSFAWLRTMSGPPGTAAPPSEDHMRMIARTSRPLALGLLSLALVGLSAVPVAADTTTTLVPIGSDYQPDTL